jgi:hypothetical protein
MESKLTISDFREKLKISTKIGSPKFKLSPFSMSTLGQSSKFFYGLFDEKEFRLTANFNFFQKPTLYVINGNYKNVNGKLKIEYKVEPRYKYQHHFWIFIAIYGFVSFNFVIFSNKDAFKLENFIMINLFLTFMSSFAIWDTTRRKKKLENRFINTFEIKK